MRFRFQVPKKTELCRLINKDLQEIFTIVQGVPPYVDRSRVSGELGVKHTSMQVFNSLFVQQTIRIQKDEK